MVSKTNSLNSKSKSKVINVFTPDYFLFLVIISIVSTLFFGELLNIKSVGNTISLFILISLLTSIILYYLVKYEDIKIDNLQDSSLIWFFIICALIGVLLIVLKMLNFGFDTYNGKLMFGVIVLLFIIVLNLFGIFGNLI
jgi:hypothetical protein